MPKKRPDNKQRELILREASILFNDKGYHATSIRDIARACKFEPANLYYYFEDKESILYEALKQWQEYVSSLLEPLENDNTMTPVERLIRFMRNHISYVSGVGRSYFLLVDTALKDLTPSHRKNLINLRDTYDRILRNIIREGITKGYFAKTDETVIANAIASLIVRIRIWFSPQGRLSIDEITALLTGFVLKGLSK